MWWQKLSGFLLLTASLHAQIVQGVTAKGVSIATTGIVQGGGGGTFSPTTTLGSLQGSNSSACPPNGNSLPIGCSKNFNGLTDHATQNGDGQYVYPGPPSTTAATNTQTTTTSPAPNNVSTVSINKLLYPGFSGTVTTKVACHYQPWFGTGSHINIGMDESNAAVVTRQAQAMIDRGCKIIIGDWYGSGDFTNTVMLLWRAELDSRCSGGTCPLLMAIMEDAGTLSGKTISGFETDLSYVRTNYFGHASYWKVTDGAGCANRPVFIDFGWTGTFSSSDWGTIKTYIHNTLGLTCTNEPVLASEGEAGLSDSNQDGGYNWLGVNNYDNTTFGTVTTQGLSGTVQFDPHFLSGGFGTDSWYSVANLHSLQPVVIGSVYKGFDDTNADWGFGSPHTQGRKMAEQCGQVWVQSFNRLTATGKYSSAAQIPAVGIVTWNDYEEGSPIEPGISNCYTVNTPSIVGSTISWTLTDSTALYGSTSTIDHFSLWLLDGAGNAQDVLDINSPTATSATIPASIPTGTWTLRVQMVGVNSIINRMSPGVTYVK